MPHRLSTMKLAPDERQIIFLKPENTSYATTYDGAEGPPAETTKLPAEHHLIPSLSLMTSYTDDFSFHQPMKRDKEAIRRSVEEQINRQAAHDSAALAMDEVPFSPNHNTPGYNREITEDDDRNTNGKLKDPHRFSVYQETYHDHDEEKMKGLRGKSVYKYEKSHVLPDTPLPPTISESKDTYVPITNAIKEHYIIHPCQGMSKYPKVRPRTITVTPEEAERLSTNPYSPKYWKNISQPLFHGPLVASHEAYKSAQTACHTWPVDGHPADSCKNTLPYHTPYQKMASDTAYTSEFNAAPIDERHPIDVKRLPLLAESEAESELAKVFENSTRKLFWNSAGADLRKYGKQCRTDGHFKDLCEMGERAQESVRGYLAPMQLSSSDRIRKGHIVGVGSTNNENIPFSGKTTYHEEIRGEAGETPNPARPHKNHVQELMVQYPDAPTGLSDYTDEFRVFPPQPTFRMTKRR